MAFSFGGFGTAAPSPAAAANAAPAASYSSNASATKNPTVTVPEFESLFPWISIFDRLSVEVSNLGETTCASSLQGQKLIHYLRSQYVNLPNKDGGEAQRRPLFEVLRHPDPLQSTNNATSEEARLRESLRTNPYILLHNKLTHVTPAIYQELMALCSDLQIGIVHAIALYAHASDGTIPNAKNNEPRCARELYFYERSEMLHALKLLLQCRLAAISTYCCNMEAEEETPSLAIVVATDELFLQHNLIATIIELIQVWTQRLDSITSRTEMGSPSVSSLVSEDSSMEQLTCNMKRSFALQQRQSLAEMLYLISYQTQFHSEELTQLIDSIHSLTDTHFNALLDPFINAPSIYNETFCLHNAEATGNLPITTASSTPKPKQQWDAEVIKYAQESGAIAIQSLTHTLIMATLCAMDASHVLWDRNTHAPNKQGNNALFSFNSTTDALYPIHQRLYDPSTEWKRREIWGLFRTAYALLLLNGANNDTTTNDNTNTFQTPTTTTRQIDTTDNSIFGGGESIDGVTSSAISSVTSCNTLHWIRTSLLPSFGSSSTTSTVYLGNMPMRSDDSEQEMERLSIFYKSTVADFLSRYLNAAAALRELPTTRAQWATDQESQMEFSRVQEEQRRQFGLFSPSGEYFSSYDDSAGRVPTSSENLFAVDYSNRPDCLDDVLACIVAVILACPACARAFWDVVTDNHTEVEESGTAKEMEAGKPRFSVTFAVLEVQRMVILDQTISSGYLSLLSLLALADYGMVTDVNDSDGAAALAIHKLLSVDAANYSEAIDWNKLLQTLESYETYLTPNKANRSPLPMGQIHSDRASFEFDNNRYYYGNDGGDNEVYYGYADSDSRKPNRSTAPSKSSTALTSTGVTRSLSEVMLSSEDEDYLKALLNLMTTVCSRCKSARDYILELRHSSVPPFHSGVKLQQHDDSKVPSILDILFRLMVKPLSVAIKGALFNLASSLVIQSTESICRMTWDLLEASQVLPTLLMSGGGVIDNRGVNVFSPDRAKLGHHITGDAYNSSCYGILHDLNHVESFIGTYPATEGLLLLIFSLVQRTGCPPNLGSKWRRPGASPYIEFVTNYVLPRSIISAHGAFSDQAPLLFATPEDRYRLIARALDVVKVVICRYPVPLSSSSVDDRKDASSEQALPSKFTGDDIRMVTPPLLSEMDSSSISDVSINDLKSIYELEAASSTGLFPPYLNLFQKNVLDSEFVDAMRDFREEEWMRIPLYNPYSHQPDQSLASRLHSFETESNSVAKHTDAPRPKSSGFAILADIIGGGALLKYILHILVQDENVVALTLLEQAQDLANQTSSLYKSGYLPVYEVVKDFTLSHSRSGIDSSSLDLKGRLSGIDITRFSRDTETEKNMLVNTPSIYPVLSADLTRSGCLGTLVSDDVLYWRLRSIKLTLHILCAAAARETSFAKAMQCCGLNSLNIIPVLKFGSHLEVQAVSTIYRVSFLLQQASGAFPFNKSVHVEPFPVLVESVGYCPPVNEYYAYPNIAEFALAMLTYASKTVTSSALCAALCGSDRRLGARRLTRSFAVQMLSQRLDSNINDSDRGLDYMEQKSLTMPAMILDLILSSLSSQEFPKLAFALLGFSDTESLLQERLLPGINCFSAILHILERKDFLLSNSSASVASRCYALLFTLCKLKGPVSSFISRFLRKNDFWARHLTRLFVPENGNDGGSSKSLFETINTCWSSLDEDSDTAEDSYPISILHCSAFLLSGVALELHRCSLGASLANSSESFHQQDYAPSHLECLRLVSLLFGTTKLVILIFKRMPLYQQNPLKFFEIGTALKKHLDSATRPLQGPGVVIPNFRCVDVFILNTKLNGVAPKQKETALNCARRWNRYVLFAAAASHLATALDCLITSYLSSCAPVLFGNIDDGKLTNEKKITNWDDILGLLNMILSRLSPPETLCLDSDFTSRFAIVSRSFPERNISTDDVNLESSSALSLSVAALRVVQHIMKMNLNEKMLIDLVRTCYLMAIAISGCSVGTASYDRAAVLSCTLGLVLPAYHQFEFLDAVSMQSDIQANSMGDAFVEVARFLSFLSSVNYKQAPDSLGYECTKLDEIATAARACLCVILRTFDIDEYPDDETFVSRVFLSFPEGRSNLNRLVNMLSCPRSDVCWILTQIASCIGGSRLLVNAGAASAILPRVSSTLNFDSNEIRDEFFDEMSRGLGTVVSEPPTEMIGQLKLLTTLVANFPESDRLLSEIGVFLRFHVSMFVHLLSSFPRNRDVTEAYLSCLALWSTALFAQLHAGERKGEEGLQLKKFGSTVASDNLLAFSITSALGDAAHRIERNVIDFALHIASQPFPEIFLSSLPSKLIHLENVQRKRLRQSDHEVGKSWWDRVNVSGLLLPNPPSGGGAEVTNFGFSACSSRGWKSEDYNVAISAAKSLEMALIFLCNLTPTSGSVSLSLNPLLLGKALCRCVIASRAIEDYLVNLSRGDKTITFNDAIDSMDVVSDALAVLGPSLGRSSERLLTLALMKAQYLSRELSSSGASLALVATKENLDGYRAVLLEVLDDTQAEQLGVGCVGLGKDVESERDFSRKTARALRDLLISLR